MVFGQWLLPDGEKRVHYLLGGVYLCGLLAQPGQKPERKVWSDGSSGPINHRYCPTCLRRNGRRWLSLSEPKRRTQ
jgi:hypothetical protein